MAGTGSAAGGTGGLVGDGTIFAPADPTGQTGAGTAGVGVTPQTPGSTGGDPNTAGTGDTNSDPAGSTVKTIADLISQGLQGSGPAAVAPTVLPVTGGSSLPILPLLLLAGAGFAVYWFFFRKKSSGGES